MTESVSCSGDEDAEISGTYTGGTGELSFSLLGDFSVTTSELLFESLGAGSFTVYAQDETWLHSQQ